MSKLDTAKLKRISKIPLSHPSLLTSQLRKERMKKYDALKDKASSGHFQEGYILETIPEHKEDKINSSSSSKVIDPQKTETRVLPLL